MQYHETSVDLIDPNSIPGDWGQIEPLLQRALDQIDSGFTTIELLCRFLQGNMQLWRIGEWQGAAVTQFADLPTHRTLTVLYLAGDGMADWLEVLMKTIHVFGDAGQAKYIEVFGRPGWEKVFKTRGGFKSYTVMRFKTDGWSITTDAD